MCVYADCADSHTDYVVIHAMLKANHLLINSAVEWPKN